MKLTRKQLNFLYDCWEKTDKNKERIAIIEREFPQIHPLVLLNKMRFMAKNDPKWIDMEINKRNKKNKEKERLKFEKQNKKNKKEIKELKNKNNKNKKEIKEKLKYLNLKEIEDKIDSNLFFCNKMQQFVNNIFCIYRIYSIEHYSVKICEKCDKMDQYIPVLKGILNVK